MLQGVVFDMDGTLIDSRLDYDAMRAEMRLDSDMRILEAIAELPADRAAECLQILQRHELEGADGATLLPGARQVLDELERLGLPLAIATRNSRRTTLAMLGKLGLEFDPILTRDDGPIKPDPWSVLAACRQWNVPPQNVVMIGDFRFDVDAGKAAGAHTVLLTHEVDPKTYPNEEQADLVIRSLADSETLLAWIGTL